MHISVNTFEGSSPHTRGALPSRELFSLAVRIIPAYAGSTAGRGSSIVAVGDHPRIRGEHLIDRAREKNVTGSSPHTRGARPGPGRGRGRGRIIPAYAGSTPARPGPASAGPDHPRIRGEHAGAVCVSVNGLGSSPHTRGAPGRAASARLHRGIIPAYAGSTPSPCYCGAARPDHPRIRGEHNLGEECSREGTGSSPHTRGAPQARLRRRFRARIIPAYAGSTTASWIGDSSRTDHPRIRGEHETHRAGHPPSTGSSPHTRGAPESAWSFQQSRRIIPAYAGSTSGSGTSGAPGRDHPRIRGEHHQMTATILNGSGSSPHTRGAHHGVRTHDRVGGIIPAYAGSTTPGVSDRGYPGDHPRIRGEHRVASRRHVQMPGSSPHTRGALHSAIWDQQRAGIIPAYAGSTSGVAVRARGRRDHPRIRGEHSVFIEFHGRYLGSSPHTRGARRIRVTGIGRCRIIPAYAGSTGSSLIRPCTKSDHPRIRGEHRSSPIRSATASGSSPHTRGALLIANSCGGQARIIPAYAGSTRLQRRLGMEQPDHPRIRGEHLRWRP